MKIVYVILHYNAFEMTKECVDSIQKIKSIDSEIVIIDNNSSNKSGLLLEKEYIGEKDIHIIFNDENLGFAKGNNIGYKYAKQVLKADVIIDMNNDIVIRQNEFENILKTIVETKKVALIAPKIINRSNRNQNPMRTTRLTTGALIKSLIYNAIFECCCHNSFMYKLFKAIHMKRIERYGTESQVEEGDIYDVIPHGSCVIFLPEYIRSAEFAFPPITFFYGEEDLLYDYLILNGMKSLYTKDLVVFHMEKVSTNTISSKEIQSDLFKASNMKSSIIATLKYRWSNKIL